ncbi:MAG: LptA/OstA family protein [Pseudomonadota bacterium]|nr:LptA/OstA family protein [Pseudomonadota bacterium]
MRRAIHLSRHGLAATLLVLVIGAPVQGQAPTLSQDTRNGPITIEATNGIEWSRADKTYIARGQAVARRGDLAVRAETLTARYRETATEQPEIFKIEAVGGVVLVSPRERVEGARGVYDVDRAMVKLTGKGLRFTSGEHVITARDSLEYWRAKELAVARGAAKVVRAQQSLRADQLTAHFRETEGAMSLALVEATGGVIIQTRDEIARGSRGVYNATTEKAILSGDVRITRGQNQLSGARAEVDFKTGVSRMLADGDKGRVKGLLTPEDKARAKQ